MMRTKQLTLADDQRHLNMAYVRMHETLNELQRVYRKDNALAKMVRTLGAMEDTLFEYVTPGRCAKHE